MSEEPPFKRPALSLAEKLQAAQQAAKAAIERARMIAKPTVDPPHYRRKRHAFPSFELKVEPKIEEIKKEAVNSENITSAVPIQFASLFDDSFTEEWWDVDVFQVDDLIQHPPVLSSSSKSLKDERIRLTPLEIEKLRKLRKKEKVQNFQDQLKMGLIDPPKPKVKLSNLMKVLSSKAVTDPSKLESEVRAQIEARLNDHLARNEERKLGKSERREKNIQKWAVKEGDDILAAVFKIEPNVSNLFANQIKFKICKNAKQLQLTGCALVSKSNKSLIIVEGRYRSVKRFERLMLKRISWNDIPDNESDDEELSQNGECKKVWEGTENKNIFRKFVWKEFEMESEAISFLATQQAQKFWIP